MTLAVDRCIRCGFERTDGGWARVCWHCAPLAEAERFCVDCGQTVPPERPYRHGRCMSDYEDWLDAISEHEPDPEGEP